MYSSAQDMCTERILVLKIVLHNVCACVQLDTITQVKVRIQLESACCKKSFKKQNKTVSAKISRHVRKCMVYYYFSISIVCYISYIIFNAQKLSSTRWRFKILLQLLFQHAPGRFCFSKAQEASFHPRLDTGVSLSLSTDYQSLQKIEPGCGGSSSNNAMLPLFLCQGSMRFIKQDEICLP